MIFCSVSASHVLLETKSISIPRLKPIHEEYSRVIEFELETKSISIPRLKLECLSRSQHPLST